MTLAIPFRADDRQTGMYGPPPYCNPASSVHLGILKSRRQDSAGAESAFDRAEELYKLKQNMEGLGEVDFQRAHWANERGDSAQASVRLDKCLEIAQPNEEPSTEEECGRIRRLWGIRERSGL
jgi:hypothetical protein